MRVPLSWIEDFTPLDAPRVELDEVVAALNQLGLEVEGAEAPGREIHGVVVARIDAVEAHPNADKLVLADVTFGPASTRVVCGAKNLVPGMLVPYAPPGARLPGGFELERRTIRGVASDGMLCSARELGMGEDHSGILDLGPEVAATGAGPGADVREVLGLDDVVLDLSITPNRPDAMCVVGVARELAAFFGRPFEVPVARVPGDADVAGAVSVVIEAPERCWRYLGWVAEVQLGPSPAWLSQRLVKAGLRPINNVVDVTNYVLLERNQPLHAFDLDRLAGAGIVVRLAQAGERMTTLDDVERELAADDLLICDAQRRPQALAGIMGGRDSEIRDDTTRVLVEAAYFEPMGIARSSKRLKVRSESSARFERGIDPEAVAANAARAMELLVEVAGARVAPAAVDEHPRRAERARIELRTSKVNAVLGTDLSDRAVLDALAPLGIDVSGEGDDIVALAPTFRPDLQREIDLVEEVARRVGFSAIGRTVPKPRDQIGGLTRSQRERRLVADALVGLGLAEAMTLPLVAEEDLRRAGAPLEAVVRAANPLRAEESVLRTSLLPGLLRAAGTNAARGLPDVSLFEAGRVFLAPGDGALLPAEPTHVAAVLTGSWRRRPLEDDRPVDVYDAVEAVRVVFAALGVPGPRLVPGARPGFDPTAAAAVEVDGPEGPRVVGSVGLVAPRVVEAFGAGSPVAALELDLDAVLALPRRDGAFVALSPYPPAVVDLAFVLDEGVTAQALVATLHAAGGPELEDVAVFDEFRSDALGAGRRSLAFRLRWRAGDRTLTDQDVAALRDRAITAVGEAHGAELRG